MKRITTIAAAGAFATALMAGTAVAAKDGPSPRAQAAKTCVSEKRADKAAFEAAYGKNAMRECKRSLRDEAREAVANASQECRAERDADPDAFAETYGTNPNGRNAFGKCVSGKAHDEAAEEVEEFKNAAHECRAERAEDEDAFAETYGTNANRRNAFGKCVSSKVREEEGSEDADE